jgi:hypothetical protein
MATVTTTPIRTFVSGETVTPAKLNELSTPTISVSSIVNADIDASAAIAGSKLAAGAIGVTQLGTGAITGQTALDALANADSLLIHDDSTSALRKVTWSQIVAAAQPVGSVLQTVQSTNSTLTACSSAIPDDNTIPQNTEGTEVLTATITPSSASNKILISVFVHGNASLDNGNNGCVAALFIGSTASAVASSYSQSFRAMNTLNPIVYLHSPNTTSATTYKVRVGAISSGSFYLNGDYLGNAKLGGTMQSTLTLQEIKG